MYSLIIIINELYYFFKFKNKFNEFKYLKSKYQSDPIPCSFYALKFIEKKLINQKITRIGIITNGVKNYLKYNNKLNKINDYQGYIHNFKWDYLLPFGFFFVLCGF